MNTVDIFPWNEHFNTGLKIVDNQHKKLVEILNSLASHIAYNSKEDDLNNIFDELTNYTLYHFETEEAIWHKYLSNDPLNSEHKAVHQQFIDTVLKLKDEQSTRPLIELAEEALGFLARWLASHILETDRYMAYLIFSLKDGLDIDSAKEQAAQKMSGSTRLLIDIILSIYGTLSTNTLHLMRELKSHQKFEEDIDNQNNYRDLLLDLSTDFINLPLVDIDSNINNALEKMANFVNTDRAYIFNYDYDANTTTNTYEWCSEGITPQIEELKNVPMKYVPGWPETHAKGKYVLIKDVGALDEGPVREILFSQGVQSLVTFPLFENSKCTGFVGFDAVKVKHDFSSSEIAILEIFSKLLSNISDRKHKESELSRERNFHKTLFKAIPDLVWVKDVKGVYLSCNSRFESFFGAKEADIIGKTDYDFVDKSLADIFQLTDNKVIKSGQSHVNEEKNPFPTDGHEVFLQTTKVPMYDQKGNLNGVMGVSRDITSIKEIQNELEEEKNRFSLAIEGTQDGLFDWNIQTNKLFYSELYETMLGYDVGERPKTADAWFGLLHPEDKERAKKNVQEYLDTKGKGIYEDTFRLRMKNNSWKWIRGRGKAQFDIDGKPLRFVGFNTDITDKKLLEQKLEKSYEMLHKLTENIPGAIFQYRLYPDGNSNFPYASKGMDDLYEISPEDIVQDASTLFKNIHPDDLSMVVSSLKESTETMKEFNLEHRVILPKKGLRWVHVKATPEKLEDDSVLFHGFSSDISERKKNIDEIKFQKEKLNDLNNRYELTLDAVEDGIWDWDIKSDFLYFSKNWAIMLGYNPEELDNNIATFYSLIYPEDMAVLQQKLNMHFKDPINNKYNVKIRLKCKDGNYNWVNSRGKVILDENKNPIRMLGYHTDISLEKKYEDELRKQKEELETIFNYSQDGIAITDLEGNFLNSNREFLKLTGLDMEELLTKNCDDMTAPDDIKKNEKIIQKAIDTNSVENIEKNFILKNDKIVAVSISVSLLPDKKRLLFLIHDNTNLKIIQEQSKLVSMGEMIGNIAHQWRQPLSVISTGVTGIKLQHEYGTLTEDILNTTCDNINKNAQYLSKTIDDFQNYIKGDRNKVEFNLLDNITSFLHLVEGSIKNNNINIILNVQDNLIVNGYPNELIQCFMNIFNNAKDAFNEQNIEKKFIIITTLMQDNKTIIKIKDNAGGISSEVLPKIFEPYFTTKHKSQGTGLGLYMTYNLIFDGMNGSIDVHNREYEYNGRNYMGAEFTIIL